MELINITSITPNPYQPRTNFDSEAINCLAASIRQHGILEPLILRESDDGYQIIAGERRFRAACSIGLTHVPAIIRNTSDSEMLEIALIENLHREDMSPIDKANGFKKLMDEFHMTQRQISEIFGISRSAICNTIRLLDLPESIMNALHMKQITEGHARAILQIKDPDKREILLRRIIARQLNVRETEELSKQISKQCKNSNGNSFSEASPEDRRFIEHLRERLGTNIHITRNGNGGKIEIDFYTREDLERIAEMI
ncbi:MAG TPA: ParB/RepB/Spo0J family partition protein [bacterium]|nr:ParB/RepB/Spo0J family partition protein [bacterium]